MSKMRRLSLLVMIPLLILGSTWPAAATEDTELLDHVLITEVMAGTSIDLNDEYIELYNPTADPVDLNGWRVERATGSVGPTTTWSQLALPPVTVLPESFVLLCRSGGSTSDCDVTFTFSLAYTGGHIRLLRPDETTPDNTTDSVEVDLIGWGNATQPEGWTASNLPADYAAPELAAGKSLERKVSHEGIMQDTDHNKNDFMLSDSSTPGALPVLPSPPSPEPDPDHDPDPEPQPEPEPIEYANLVINEVMPDPVSPKTDAEDEYIELYNPNTSSVNLKGYIIQTGNSLQYRYEIPSGTLAARGYRAFYAKHTNLTLSNSGSRIQLLAPDNTVAATLVKYEESEAGESWARFSSKFAWTDRLTPGAVNQTHSPEQPKTSTSTKRTTATAQIKKSYRITITEVLPDPAIPQKDADDEFVELYNPNNFAVPLDGYRIKSGSTLRSSAVLDGLTIRPKSFIAVFNKEVNLSLSNKGGQVVLHDPNKKEIYRVTPYPEAEEGQSWAFISSKWQWTAKPTPAARNVAQSGSTSNSGATTQSSSSLNSNTNPINGVFGALDQPAALPDAPANWRLIAGVGTAAAFYMAYESRHDLRNWAYRWHRWREVRRAAGK